MGHTFGTKLKNVLERILGEAKGEAERGSQSE